MSMERGTGGNRFIPADADILALMLAIQNGLYDLEDWAEGDPDLTLDLGRVSVSTQRSFSGSISVEVSADLRPEVTET